MFVSLHHLIFALIDQAATLHLWWLPASITIATMLLEDTTTAVVGLLAAEGLIPVSIAFSSLVLGIFLGDLLLYTIGRLARTHQFFARFASRKEIEAVSNWIHERTFQAVVTMRFLPGFRIPLFLGCGLLGIPLRKYVFPVFCGAFLWATFLFGISYLFGKYTFGWLGLWQWPVIIGALFVFFFAGRVHVRRVLKTHANPVA